MKATVTITPFDEQMEDELSIEYPTIRDGLKITLERLTGGDRDSVVVNEIQPESGDPTAPGFVVQVIYDNPDFQGDETTVESLVHHWFEDNQWRYLSGKRWWVDAKYQSP